MIKKKIKDIVFFTERCIDKIAGRQVIHFLHIGKTGGSAIKSALRRKNKTRQYVIALHSHKFRLRDCPDGEKVIFCVREPLQRFISGFYSRQRQGQPLYHVPWSEEEAAAFHHFETPNELALGLSANDPEIKKKAIAAMQSIQHVKNSYWDWFENEAYFVGRIADILLVCEQEKLNNDFARLKKMIGLPDNVALPKNSDKAHINPKNLDKKLDEQAVINLEQWYAKDYAFLDLLRKHDLI